MPAYDYDLFVIGAGSGGVRAARLAGALGKRVAVAEDNRLGGTCVNRGCIPKKLYAYAAHYAEDFEDAAGFGWTVGERSFDWSKLESKLRSANAVSIGAGSSPPRRRSWRGSAASTARC